MAPPRPRAIVAFVLGLGLALGACAPWKLPPNFGGAVHASCDGKKGPIADARVEVRCPDQPAPLLVGKTDATGRFDIGLGRTIPRACVVEVSHEGYATRRFTADDVCLYALDPSGKPFGECDMAGLSAELQPVSVKP